MKNTRVLRFAMGGLVLALALEAWGYAMDHTVPRPLLGDQVLYNWLTLWLSPLGFFLRLSNPDGPIVASVRSFLAVVLSNALLYGVLSKAGQLCFARLRQKLLHENIALVAKSHPERIIRLVAPNWKPRLGTRC